MTQINNRYYKGLVINYWEGGGGAATEWENRGSETFCAPFKTGLNFVRPPPPLF